MEDEDYIENDEADVFMLIDEECEEFEEWEKEHKSE